MGWTRVDPPVLVWDNHTGQAIECVWLSDFGTHFAEYNPNVKAAAEFDPFSWAHCDLIVLRWMTRLASPFPIARLYDDLLDIWRKRRVATAAIHDHDPLAYEVGDYAKAMLATLDRERR